MNGYKVNAKRLWEEIKKEGYSEAHKQGQQDALIKIKEMIKEKVSLNGYNIETVNYENILEIIDNLLEEAKE